MDANEMAIFITNWMGKRGLVTTSEQAMNVKELCFDVQMNDTENCPAYKTGAWGFEEVGLDEGNK